MLSLCCLSIYYTLDYGVVWLLWFDGSFLLNDCSPHVMEHHLGGPVSMPPIWDIKWWPVARMNHAVILSIVLC